MTALRGQLGILSVNTRTNYQPNVSIRNNRLSSGAGKMDELGCMNRKRIKRQTQSACLALDVYADGWF